MMQVVKSLNIDLIHEELKKINICFTNSDNEKLRELNEKVICLQRQLDEKNKILYNKGIVLSNKKEMIYKEYHINAHKLKYKYKDYLYKREYKQYREYYDKLISHTD